MDGNYCNGSVQATTESAKNKGVRRSKKFVLHVDTDWLDRNSRERFGTRMSAKAKGTELIEAPTERSRSSLRA